MKPGQILKKLPELKAKRLILRNVRLSDAADIFEYASLPQMTGKKSAYN
jgi:hypothetical protein